MLALEPHTAPIARAPVGNTRYPRHEPLAARIQTDQRVGALRLHDAHLRRAYPLVGSDQAHVLGAHAEMDLAFVAIERHLDRPRAAVHDSAPASRRPPPPLEDVHAGAAEEARDEDIRGPLVHLGGGAQLSDAPAVQNGQPLRQAHRLTLVVCDIQHGGVEGVVQLEQLSAELAAEGRVEVRQGLIEEERLRLAHDRAPQRHALSLAARELRRTAVQQRGDAQPLGGSLYPAGHLARRHSPHLEAEGDVAAHAQVRV